jgi:multicomponent Na+:H+ antiporter subunit C
VSILDWYLCVAAALTVLGSVRLLLARDPLVRLICINVAGSGALLALVALATRSDPPDPVPHALVLTGIVITVAFTGVGLVLLRRTEESPPESAEPAAEESGR